MKKEEIEEIMENFKRACKEAAISFNRLADTLKTIPVVVGQSEQLFCPECKKRIKMKGDGTLEPLCEC